MLSPVLPAVLPLKKSVIMDDVDDNLQGGEENANRNHDDLYAQTVRIYV
jgi:hypothetical protein